MRTPDDIFVLLTDAQRCERFRKGDGYGSVIFPNGSVAVIPGEMHNSVAKVAVEVSRV